MDESRPIFILLAEQIANDILSGALPEAPYTTLHVGVMHGGTAVNIISRECSFSWDIRTLPGDDWRQYLSRLQAFADTLLAPMQAISPHASITTEVLADAPPLQDQGGKAQDLVFDLCGYRHTDVVPYAAEAGQFQERGFDVVLCGPGSIDQAHQPDEFIEVEQVSACEHFMEKLADRLAG